jgi:hypothetical protein
MAAAVAVADVAVAGSAPARLVQCVEGLPLRVDADVRVVLQHPAREVPVDRLEDVVGNAAFGKLERALLMPMPTPFDGYVELPARVSSTSLVTVARKGYSVPCARAGHRSIRCSRADGPARRMSSTSSPD